MDLIWSWLGDARQLQIQYLFFPLLIEDRIDCFYDLNPILPVGLHLSRICTKGF